MSEQERQKFDIKSYIAYFKNSTFSGNITIMVRFYIIL
jgi:hypothetical protein